MRTRRPLARARRLRRGADLLWACLAVAVLLAVESIGRSLHSDLADAAMVCVLAFLLGVVVLLVPGRPSRIGRALRRGAVALRARVVAWLRVEIGVDLRGQPPIPTRPLPMWRTALRVLAGANALVLLLLAFWPVPWRATVAPVLYLVHLAGLLLLWSAVVGVVACAVFFTVGWVHDRFVLRHVGRHRRRLGRELLAIAVVLSALLAASVGLPPWLPVLGVLFALVVFLAVLRRPGALDLDLLWRRPPPGDRTVHRVGWRRALGEDVVIVVLAWTLLVLLANGRRAVGFSTPAPDLPVTAALGAVLAWCAGAALAGGLLVGAAWFVARQRLDPARASPTEVHLGGRHAGHPEAQARLRARGFRVVVAPHPPGPGAVRLEVHAGPMPPLGGRPTWPLRVSATALGAPELLDLVARRDVVQRRRRLLRGLERAFRAAAARSFSRGAGFWVAPHLWFISGLARDADDQEEFDAERDPILSEVVGAPWHRVLDLGARAYLHRVLGALDVDLLFVEDGVGFRGLRRVLRALFDHHDVHGRRVEERHLVGIPGVRCVLHEFTLGNPWRQEGYPEPDYEEIGRARILHVFRDRGGREDPVEAPADREGRPAPSPALSG